MKGTPTALAAYQCNFSKSEQPPFENQYQQRITESPNAAELPTSLKSLLCAANQRKRTFFPIKSR